MTAKKITLLYLVGILLMILAFSETSKAETKLTWDPNKDANSYTVYAREKGQTEFKAVKAGITDTSAVITPEKFNQTYEYSVKAFNVCGNASDYSDPVAYNDCSAALVGKVVNIRIEISLAPSGGR